MQRFIVTRDALAGFARLAATLAASLVLAGCGLKSIMVQTERLDAASTIEGKVIAAAGVSLQDLLVVLLRQDEGGVVLYRAMAPTPDGSFSIVVPDGRFYAGAFEDRNHDGQYQPSEPAQFYGKPTLLKVKPREREKVQIAVTATSKPVGIIIPDTAPRVAQVGANMGVVASLADDRFDPANGQLGMWKPIDFLAGPQGGLFLLSPYDPQRIPVLFVHGIAGTPRDFKRTIARLDHAKYQPWVAYYPSGLRLDMVANGIASGMHQIQRRYGFRQYAVVAHSMGGLVARAYIQKVWEQYPEQAKALRMFVTVNTPLGGMSSAAYAVENSPLVIPSWQDVAAGSPFLAELGHKAWHSDVPYYLVFSFEGDDNGDGVVALSSQLAQPFQDQARRTYGFQNTHVGTLSDLRFTTLLNKLLDNTFPPRFGRK